MRRWLLAFVLIAGCEASPNPAWAYSDDQIANAIWRAEGGERAVKPYGVLSVPVSGAAEARAVTLRSLRNHRIRHATHACRLDFIGCFSKRWCPPSAHPLNRYFEGNLRKILEATK